MFILFLPQTPLRALRLGEIYCFFLSQRRQGRKELQCLICSYSKHLCVRTLRLREIILVFFSRKGAETAEKFKVYFVFTPNTFACFASWRDLLFFFSRKGAKAAKNFNV